MISGDARVPTNVMWTKSKVVSDWSANKETVLGLESINKPVKDLHSTY